jgi:hypothetical protein
MKEIRAGINREHWRRLAEVAVVIRLPCRLIGADGPEGLQVIGQNGIVEVNGGSLRGNL